MRRMQRRHDGHLLIRIPIAAGLAISFLGVLAGCGGDAPRLELAGVPLSTEMKPLIEDVRRSFDAPDPGVEAVKRDFDRLYALQKKLFVSATRVEAATEILDAWRRQPDHFIWCESVIRNRSLIGRNDEIVAILADPALTDTMTAVGLYARCWREVGYTKGGGDIRRAWDLRASLDPLQSYWLTLKMAWIERLSGNAEAAVRLAMSALPAAREQGGRRASLQAWREVVLALKLDGRLDDALYAAVAAEDLATAVTSETGNVYPMLNARLLRADVLAARRESEGALALYESCTDSAFTAGLLPLAAKSLNHAGILTQATCEYARGLRFYRQGLAIALADGDSINIPKHLMNVSRRHRLLGSLDSCLVYQRRAEQWNVIYPNLRNRARMPLMQAEYYAQIGDYATVDSLLDAAVRLKPNQTSVQALAELHLRLIDESVERGRPDQAYRSIAVLDALRGRLGDALADRHVALDLDLHSADFLARQGRYLPAAEALERVERALARRDDPVRQWKLDRARGDLARRRGDLRSAEAAYQACLDLGQVIGDPDRVSTTRFLLGTMLLDRARYAEARRLFPDTESSDGRFRTRLSTLLFRGMSFTREGRFDDALAELTRARRLCTPWSPPDLMAGIDLEMGRALVGAGRADEARDHYRAVREGFARTISERQSDIRTLFDTDLRRELAEAELMLLVGDDGRDVSGDAALSALGQVQEILPVWNRAETDFGKALVTPQLVFLVGRRASFRWSVTADDARLTRLPGESELLDRLAPVLADLAQPGRVVVPRELQEMVSALGGDPGSWPAGGTLAIVPDGVLHAVPWAALPRTPSETWLDRGPLAVSTSPARGRLVASHPRTDGRLLAMGVDGSASAGAAGLSTLRHAEREAREIHDLWPAAQADLHVGRDAAGEGITAADLELYDTIHVASHALVYRGAPEQTSLLLAGTVDAPLTAGEIRRLDLDADLIFLSCCEAAEGYARVAGSAHAELARSFLDAGARAVVAPSVSIDDEAARLLAGRFYEHWLSGLTVPAALRRAQLDLRDGDPRWSHPFYWSFHISITNPSVEI
jgi:tetratricopeptide (TPR) repeat protein